MSFRDIERGSVWGLTYEGVAGPRPVVVVSSDARNRSRFEWVHVVRITSRSKPRLPTIVELSARDAPVRGRAMCDEVEMVPKDDLEDVPGLRGRLSHETMEQISSGLRLVLDLD